jgi:hypothetical protein
MGEYKRKKINWHIIIFIFVLLSLVISAVYSAISITVSSPGADMIIPYERNRSDYILMLTQCILGIIVMLLPSVLAKRFKWNVPKSALIVYVLFLYCGIVLGEVRSFYYRISFWDTILHAFCGICLGILGIVVVYVLNEHDKTKVNLSPLFVSLFAFCFAVTLGIIWEIYEFACDALVGLNMQKYMLDTGENLVGKTALIDTMEDIIVDTIAAFSVALTCFFVRRRKKVNADNGGSLADDVPG